MKEAGKRTTVVGSRLAGFQGLAGILNILSADAAARSEDMVVAGDGAGRSGHAEAGNIGIRAGVPSAAPGVKGGDGPGHVGIGQFAVDAVD